MNDEDLDYLFDGSPELRKAFFDKVKMSDKKKIIERLKGNKLKKGSFMGMDIDWVSDDGHLDYIFGNKTKGSKELEDKIRKAEKK